MEHINADTITEIIDILEIGIDEDGNSIQDNLIDLNIEDFKAIVSFTERYICPREELVDII